MEDKIHRPPLSYFDSRLRGELLSRVTNDVDNIATTVSMTISQLLTAALTVVAVLLMMLTISTCADADHGRHRPTVVVGNEGHRASLAADVRRPWANTGRLNAHVEETYSGFTVVKTYGHGEATRRRFGELNAAVYRSGFGAQFFSGLVSPATVLVSNLGYVAVAVVGGTRWPPAESLWVAFRRVHPVRPAVQPAPDPRSRASTTPSSPGWPAPNGCSNFSTNRRNPRTPMPNCRPARPDPVRDRLIRLPDRHLVIRELSLTAEPRQHRGDRRPHRRGKDHAGEPADAVLRRRFRADPGGRHRYPDRQPCVAAIRIGMVPQDTWLMSGTITENIRYGRPGASEDDIIAAARAAASTGSSTPARRLPDRGRR